MNSKPSPETLVVGTVGSLFAGLLLHLMFRPSKYALGELVNPAAVAALVPDVQDTETFILSSAKWVSENIDYENFATELKFRDFSVYCSRCFSPTSIIKRGSSNCVGMSLLLASMLRNRLSDEEVYVALGDLATNGTGGHAWVVAWKEDSWWIVDATRTPPFITLGENPSYRSDVYFNDKQLLCLSKANICVRIRA